MHFTIKIILADKAQKVLERIEKLIIDLRDIALDIKDILWKMWQEMHKKNNL